MGIYIHTYIHTYQTQGGEKSGDKCHNSGYSFPKSYLPHNHPIAHFLSVGNFSGTFREPRHLLTGTGLKTKEKQVSQVRQTLGTMPHVVKASPKQSRGTQREIVGRVSEAEAKCSGQTWDLRARILKFNVWRPSPILAWIPRNFPNLQSVFHLFQMKGCFISWWIPTKARYSECRVKETWSWSQEVYKRSRRDTEKYT